ncbi:Bacterial type II secretion system protein F domain protein [Vibrio aerogenes CECT 7868]|uniref:Bacterial type II secretion system protein F domain protein n=1 Tax=Vibrio aerogenes CECT 7868 TaxID=1216006 RepID=A0A1M5ZSW9_9VIBR|nr:type II secretion system F family protein [Vibrio aerogenes]SHI27268.1 Bacterial type II secretion system protein F domain protein [Vibrio aerogenes CECT 7868]
MMLWDGMTGSVFVLLFCLMLGGRYAWRIHAWRKARAQYLSQLEQMMADGQRVSEESSLQRLADDMRFASLPVIGGMMQRFWTDIGLLGWQAHWLRRAAMLLIPSAIVSVAVSKDATAPVGLSLGLTLVLFSVALLTIYLRAMSRHLDEFRQNLPQAIDAIVRAVRAGVPASNTFLMVAENLPGPLAAEFMLIDNWLKVGIPLRDAMRDSAARIPLNEYRFFVVILIINQDTGGKLGETLERLSDTLRARQELALKIKAKTSEVRASAVIVALLAPLSLTYMYFNSPADFGFLLNDPTGNRVLIYAVCSVCLGLAVTHYMIRRVIR